MGSHRGRFGRGPRRAQPLLPPSTPQPGQPRWRFGAACPASHHSSSAPRGGGGAAPAPPSRPTASYRLHGGSPGACDAGHGQRKLWAEAGPPRGAPATAAPGGGGRAGPVHAGPVRRGRAAGQLRRLSS